jgi:pilus assembly protein CpaE
VFIVSENSDPQVLIQALRVGVKEFLPAPLNEKAVNEALERFLDRQEKIHQKSSGHLGRIISLIGSKGGVGTTTIAVNLADSLTRKPERFSVALMDMNMVFGDIPMFLDISPKHHWGDITKNIDRLDEFFLANILTRAGDRLDVLPSPGYLDSNSTLPTPRVIETLLELMTKAYDYIVIDLGQSINETALKIVRLSNLVEIVTIQTLPCLSNASRLIKSLLDHGYTDKTNLDLILNRYIKKGLVDLDTAEQGLNRKISWLIPNDYPTTMSAINSGKPLMETAPKSKIARCFEDYTDTIFPEKNDKTKKKGWFF